jgi:multiple sugar transport system permease protein
MAMVEGARRERSGAGRIFGFGRRKKGNPRADSRRRIGESRITPYLFILPHLIVFIAIIGVPFVLGLWISIHRSTPLREGPYVGFDNYVRLLDPASLDFPRYWTTMWNTILFVLMSTPLLVIVGLVLAALLNQRLRGRNLFRGIFFAPWTLSVAVVGLTWWWMFSGKDGVIPRFLIQTFGSTPGWLTSNPWAWITILIATLWWTIGFNTIILLAGMQGIAPDLYEAAAIDGAGRWAQFRHITIPSLRPVLLLVVTLQVIASFQLVGQPQLMTGGGPPPTETTPVLLHIYNVGFTGRGDLSLAAAMAVIVALLMVVVSIVNFRLFSSERA